MKSGFDANVPRRKPRTRLGTMLAEIDAPEIEEIAEEADLQPDAPAATAQPAADDVPSATGSAQVVPPAQPSSRKADRPAPARTKAKQKGARKRSAASPRKAIQGSAGAPQALPLGTAPVATADVASPVLAAPVAEAVPAAPVAQPEVRPAATQTEVRAATAQSDPPRRPTEPVPGADAVLAGRARISELKARLEAAARKQADPSPAPVATAERVRETVAGLRDRLQQTELERAEAVRILDETRTELSALTERYEAEQAARTVAEATAAERAEVATGLIAEAEALAEERDQALARIGELRDLDRQQTALLGEIEAALAARETELAAARAEAAELRAALEAATVDLDTLQGRFDTLSADRARLDAELAAVHKELERAAGARDALAEIQRLVDGV